MALSVYDFCVTPLIHGLTNMSAILDKASAYAETKKFDSVVLSQARLFPDMHPLSRQVQIACDTAKGAAGRLAQIEVPKHADTETTIAELKARIAKTVEFLKTVTPAQVQGAESRDVELKFPSGSWKFSGSGYVTDFVMPNFYFHASMVYALLRNSGVDIGKGDYLGAIQKT
jgi:uncharacterized protein